MRNYRKVQVLEFLYNGGAYSWYVSWEVAIACDLSITNASELLRRYHRQGLLARHRNQAVPKGFWYQITDAGYRRLIYLQGLFELEGTD
ncbi:hypothetical protein [Dehalogenimonas etheniformans]|uniref:MarR family transcriptional regulator n=1 Tax=Dehalogenimonas etheniformans TaxID=1536648 RepID=A0A2P5P5K5_9CHLR|nr:hypothetical protein [Dehalogenimonas etheniformans]PPD57573.1 hypothetical protein JP09_007435 [Dehalogenimonas etheniformans]QNT75911.1 hypothetical protein HX448_04015 [Dehalogenimonas etheniformans]